jgi:hypothetical protein
MHEAATPAGFVALARAAVADGADVLGVAGGDGSLAAVAAVAIEAELPFVCVPAGIRNHFARDLGLDRADPAAAIEAFVAGPSGEPTTGLDPRSRAELWSVIRQLVAGGTTVLLTTQYLEEADRLADRIAVLDNGRIVADDTPNALKRQLGAERLLLRLQRGEDLLRAGGLLATQADRADTGPHLDADAGEVTMAIHHPDQLRHALVRLDQAGIAVEQVELRTPTLDDVFFELTKAAA